MMFNHIINRSMYLFTLIIVLLSCMNRVEALDVKFALIMSGNVTDLGFNFMVNDGRIRMEYGLKLKNPTVAYSMIDSDQKLITTLDSLIASGYNFIFPSSQIHMTIAEQYAKNYTNIYWFLRGRAPSKLPNVVNLGFNSGSMQYLIGYFAGSETKTGNVGFIAPGMPVQKCFTTNAFYVGVKAANASVNVYYAFTGNWMDPDLARGASRLMIDKYNVDMIGQSQDDMSVQEEVMSNRTTNNFGLGSTGYSERLIYGDAMGISYLTNWTTIFTRYVEQAQNGTWVNGAFQGELANGAIEFDEMSFRARNSTVTNFYSEKARLTNDTTYQPYLCSPGYVNEFNMTNGCIKISDFWNSQKVLVQSQFNLGLYSIPITIVPTAKSMVYGLSITAGLFILLALISMIIVIIYRKAKVIKSASPLFSVGILLGCMMIFAGVIVWAQDPTSPLCRARIWLISLGYTFMIGNLLIKNFRIWLLFDNPKLKRRNIPNSKLVPWFIGILILDAIILAIWVGIGDVQAILRRNIDGLGTYEALYACDMNRGGDIMLYIILLFHGIMLLVGCFISFKIRTVDIKEFNECRPVTTCLYAIAFCLFIIIPLMVSPQSISNQNIILCASFIFTTFSTITLLFLPKFAKMYTEGPAINETFRSSTNKENTFTVEVTHNTAAYDDGVSMDVVGNTKGVESDSKA